MLSINRKMIAQIDIMWVWRKVESKIKKSKK